MNQKWTEFLSGEWQREIPKEEGIFPTADHTGTEASMIVVYQHPVTQEFLTPNGWKGYFWSKPYPGLPKAKSF
jgi:hypothetical protein